MKHHYSQILIGTILLILAIDDLWTEMRLHAALGFLFGGIVCFYIYQLAKRKSDKEIRAAHDWSNAILRATQYSIISTDAEGVIQTFNEASVKMLGYEPSEIIGKCTPKLFHLQEEVIERAKSLSKTLNREVMPGMDAFTASAKANNGTAEAEWTFVRKDGSHFPASLSLSVLYGTQGEIVGYLGVSIDLTERKRFEENITVTNDRLTRVIESTGQGLWEREYAPNGKIYCLDDQAKKIFGIEGIANPTYEQIIKNISPEDMAASRRIVEEHVASKSAGYSMDFRIAEPGAKKKFRWIRANGKVVPRVGRIPLLVSTVSDVTDEVEKRLQLNNALKVAEEATKAKSEFLANMSHEIRTPINGVMGMAGLLLDLELGSEQRKCAETIRSSADILLNLVNDILDFSKIEAGKLELEEIDFDIDQLTKSIERLVSLGAKQKGLKIFRAISSDLPTTSFRGDPNRLSQVLSNLLSNAVKFTSEGIVEMKVFHDAALSTDEKVQLHIEIKDTGIGMSPNTSGRMFQRFTQADASMSRRFGGTGLGLSICKHLINVMGGSIGVESKEHEGSTFWISLPLQVGEKIQKPEAPKTKELKTTNGKKIRILLAEDNPVNQLIARKMLEKNGFTVDIVGNGLEAVESLRSIPYDLVLMDCQMPEMDGYEATKKIRIGVGIQNPKIPIVAMTANAMIGDREICLAAGMTDYVSKPVKEPDLVSIIHKHIWEKLAAA
jgi:PAS domain S-box-containing protein